MTKLLREECNYFLNCTPGECKVFVVCIINKYSYGIVVQLMTNATRDFFEKHFKLHSSWRLVQFRHIFQKSRLALIINCTPSRMITVPILITVFAYIFARQYRITFRYFWVQQSPYECVKFT